MNKSPWPLPTLHMWKDAIDTNPDFQRPAVWTLAQKRLLIDSVLRGFDIPKLYWREMNSTPKQYAVIDGQQRIRAIWEFMDNKFKLPQNADPVDGQPIANCKYNELSREMTLKIHTYSLDVVIMKDMTEDEVREMFLRLQNGTSLKAQEKRNALSGNMRDFIKHLSEQSFFESVPFKNSRYDHDLVAAQLTCLEIEPEITNIQNKNLNRMYEENKEFDMRSKTARKVKKTLATLREIFPEKTPELERYNIVALYCVVSRLLDGYVISDVKDHMHDWFVDFEHCRKEEKRKPEDEQDPKWMAYQEQIGHSNDHATSIAYRVNFMFEKLFKESPSVRLKDKTRLFTHEQRLAIFRRDDCRCQLKVKCAGKEKLKWDNWHCDHKKPWSKGGETIVDNGQVTCAECNLAKAAAI